MRKLGIFGGTFNPVHWGHLLVAEAAVSQVPLEQVIWVPTQHPPHKQAENFEHRCQMVMRALQDNPMMQIAPCLPSNHAEAAYAIQTLIDLKALYPHTRWYWIIGLDAFLTLPRWYRRQELITECTWLVAPRLLSTESNQPHAPEQLCAQVAQTLNSQSISIYYLILQVPYVGISASFIRRLCRERRSIRYLVPDAVREYIASYNLYLQE